VLKKYILTYRKGLKERREEDKMDTSGGDRTGIVPKGKQLSVTSKRKV